MIEGYSEKNQLIWIKEYLIFLDVYNWKHQRQGWNYFPHYAVICEIADRYIDFGIDKYGIHLLLRWYGLSHTEANRAQQDNFQKWYSAFDNHRGQREALFWKNYFPEDRGNLQGLRDKTHHYLVDELYSEKTREADYFYKSFGDSPLSNEGFYPRRWETLGGKPRELNGFGQPIEPPGKRTTWCWISRMEFERRIGFTPSCLSIFDYTTDKDLINHKPRIKEKYYGKFNKGEWKYCG